VPNRFIGGGTAVPRPIRLGEDDSARGSHYGGVWEPPADLDPDIDRYLDPNIDRDLDRGLSHLGASRR
jgi:hypothetical protein